MLVEDKTLPVSVIIFKAGNSLSLFANCYLQILKISYVEFHKATVTSFLAIYIYIYKYMYIYIFVYIYIYICIYTINL